MGSAAALDGFPGFAEVPGLADSPCFAEAAELDFLHLAKVAEHLHYELVEQYLSPLLPQQILGVPLEQTLSPYPGQKLQPSFA
jgi:hypothetical protein